MKIRAPATRRIILMMNFNAAAAMMVADSLATGARISAGRTAVPLNAPASWVNTGEIISPFSPLLIIISALI